MLSLTPPSPGKITVISKNAFLQNNVLYIDEKKASLQTITDVKAFVRQTSAMVSTALAEIFPEPVFKPDATGGVTQTQVIPWEDYANNVLTFLSPRSSEEELSSGMCLLQWCYLAASVCAIGVAESPSDMAPVLYLSNRDNADALQINESSHREYLAWLAWRRSPAGLRAELEGVGDRPQPRINRKTITIPWPGLLGLTFNSSEDELEAMLMLSTDVSVNTERKYATIHWRGGILRLPQDSTLESLLLTKGSEFGGHTDFFVVLDTPKYQHGFRVQKFDTTTGNTQYAYRKIREETLFMVNIYEKLNNSGNLSGKEAQAWLSVHFSNAMHGNYTAEQLLEKVPEKKGLTLSRLEKSQICLSSFNGLFNEDDWPEESLFDTPELQGVQALAVIAAAYSNACKNLYTAKQLAEEVSFSLNDFSLSLKN